MVGGRSLLEGSLEARIKVTDTIGVVPFVDAGGAFDSGFPDFDDKMRFSAGLGLALLHGDRSDPPRRGGAARPSPGRQAGLHLCQHRAGILMTMMRRFLIPSILLSLPRSFSR